MGKVIVIEFVTLDGVVEDPDGSGATPGGGWAFRYGPEATAGDKFALGPVLDTGTMLLGRKTFELFSRIFPNRTDEFSQKLNAIPKLVASRSLARTDGWANSALLRGDLADEVAHRKEHRDLVVAGSAGLIDELVEHDLIDEYRLLVFPTVLGRGRRLFSGHKNQVDLELTAAERVGGQAVRMVYNRRRDG